MDLNQKIWILGGKKCSCSAALSPASSKPYLWQDGTSRGIVWEWVSHFIGLHQGPRVEGMAFVAKGHCLQKHPDASLWKRYLNGPTAQGTGRQTTTCLGHAMSSLTEEMSSQGMQVEGCWVWHTGVGQAGNWFDGVKMESHMSSWLYRALHVDYSLPPGPKAAWEAGTSVRWCACRVMGWG